MDQAWSEQDPRRVQTGHGALSHIFGTNDPPSHLEVGLLKEGVNTLSTKISQTRLDLANLEQQLFLHRMGSSPARRVPAEILSEIFAHAGWAAFKHIVLVCRTWHRASSSIASMRHSELSIKFSGQDGVSRSCQKIRSWFEKAGKSRKSLRMMHMPSLFVCGCPQTPDVCPWANPELPETLMGLTLDGLTLEISTPSCLLSLVRNLRRYESSNGSIVTAWESLRSLELKFPFPSLLSVPAAYRTILINLPKRLKNFRLQLMRLGETQAPPEVIVPSEQFLHLTSLEIYCSWNSPLIVSVLRHCVNIESLILNTHPGEETWTETVAGVTLATVRTLRVEVADARPSEAFRTLQLLHLPALVDLTIYCTDNDDEEVSWKVLQSLRLLPPGQVSSLWSLSISCADLEAEHLIKVLLAIPTLERFVLDYVQLNAKRLLDLELARIMADQTSSVLVPRLKYLEVRLMESQFELQTFLEFVKVREKHIASLRREAGPLSSIDSSRLRYIKADFFFWDDEAADTWRRSSTTVQELERDFGIVVDRILPDEEEEVEEGDFRWEF
ncbi:hypothetical protein NMY22_g12724 [Coprinellus aureogranulatus]|nr:hypothetical protein NMY22_g12724 [Coprinellus aureogranulatus]